MINAFFPFFFSFISYDIYKNIANDFSSVDLVYESVGGTTFEVCVNNLAVKGRLIIIGMISGYQDGSTWSASSGNINSNLSLSARLLPKSASVRGFFLPHYFGAFEL